MRIRHTYLRSVSSDSWNVRMLNAASPGVGSMRKPVGQTGSRNQNIDSIKMDFCGGAMSIFGHAIKN